MLKTLLVTGTVVFVGQIASADETLGTWCWKMAPANNSMNAEITLKKTSSGEYVMERTFYDGSRQTLGLRVVGTNRFVQKDSDFGDGVQIRADGALQMFDSDGALDRAQRTSAGSCIR